MTIMRAALLVLAVINSLAARTVYREHQSLQEMGKRRETLVSIPKMLPIIEAYDAGGREIRTLATESHLAVVVWLQSERLDRQMGFLAAIHDTLITNKIPATAVCSDRECSTKAKQLSIPVASTVGLASGRILASYGLTADVIVLNGGQEVVALQSTDSSAAVEDFITLTKRYEDPASRSSLR